MEGPAIALIMDPETGKISNVAVLAQRSGDRHQGLAVIQELRHELDVFEERVQAKLAQIAARQ